MRKDGFIVFEESRKMVMVMMMLKCVGPNSILNHKYTDKEKSRI